MTPRALATVASLAILSGCMTVGHAPRRYQPQSLALWGTRTSLTELVEAYVRAHGWRVVAMTRYGPGPAVEALSVREDVLGVNMRNRWYFWVEDNQVRVELRSEARFHPRAGSWESTPLVCDTYSYHLERQQLLDLAAFAQHWGRAGLAQIGMVTTRH